MKQLAAALVAATKGCPPVEKRGHNKHGGYDYALADDVVKAATKALQANGLTVVPTGSSIETREFSGTKGMVSALVTIRGFRVLHVSGEFIDGAVAWPIVVRAGDSGKGAAAAETTAYSYYLKTLLDMDRDPSDDIDYHGDAFSGDRTASARPMATGPDAKLIAQVRSIDSSERFAAADRYLNNLVDLREADDPKWRETGFTASGLDLALEELERKR